MSFDPLDFFSVLPPEEVPIEEGESSGHGPRAMGKGTPSTLLARYERTLDTGLLRVFVEDRGESINIDNPIFDEITPGAPLVLFKTRSRDLSLINPEWLMDDVDRASNHGRSPTFGTVGRLEPETLDATGEAICGTVFGLPAELSRRGLPDKLQHPSFPLTALLRKPLKVWILDPTERPVQVSIRQFGSSGASPRQRGGDAQPDVRSRTGLCFLALQAIAERMGYVPGKAIRVRPDSLTVEAYGLYAELKGRDLSWSKGGRTHAELSPGEALKLHAAFEWESGSIFFSLTSPHDPEWQLIKRAFPEGATISEFPLQQTSPPGPVVRVCDVEGNEVLGKLLPRWSRSPVEEVLGPQDHESPSYRVLGHDDERCWLRLSPQVWPGAGLEVGQWIPGFIYSTHGVRCVRWAQGELSRWEEKTPSWPNKRLAWLSVTEVNREEQTISLAQPTAIRRAVAELSAGGEWRARFDESNWATFNSPQRLTEGEEIDVYLTMVNWAQLPPVVVVERFQQPDPRFVMGEVVQQLAEGFRVRVGEEEGFLPLGELWKPKKSGAYPAKLVGRNLSLLDLGYDASQGARIYSQAKLKVVEGSRKAVLFNTLKVGDRVRGRVCNITDWGAFVSLGGFQGLLHITDMAWAPTGHPSDYVSVGDELEAVVISHGLDRSGNQARIGLSLRELLPDPWLGLEERYPVGKTISGRVVTLKDDGAFVEIEPGIQGLVHLSELTWNRRVKHPSRVVSVGQEVTVQVIAVDTENQRISLSIKVLQSDPWVILKDEVEVGSIIEGPIRNIVDFGLFVRVLEGIDGLVHISDIRWGEPPSHPTELYQKGQRVRAQVTSITPESHRLGLSIKHLSPPPKLDVLLGKELPTAVVGRFCGADTGQLKFDLGDDAFGWLDPGSTPEHLNDRALSEGIPLDTPLNLDVVEFDPESLAVVLQWPLVGRSSRLRLLKPGQYVNGTILQHGEGGLVVRVGEDSAWLSWAEIALDGAQDEATGSRWKVGGEVSLRVLDVHPDAGYLRLSGRHYAEPLWERLLERVKAWDSLDVTVVSCREEGLWVRIDPEGLMELIPAAEIQDAQTYEVGEQLSVHVESIDPVRYSLALTQRIKLAAIREKPGKLHAVDVRVRAYLKDAIVVSLEGGLRGRLLYEAVDHGSVVSRQLYESAYPIGTVIRACPTPTQSVDCLLYFDVRPLMANPWKKITKRGLSVNSRREAVVVGVTPSEIWVCTLEGLHGKVSESSVFEQRNYLKQEGAFGTDPDDLKPGDSLSLIVKNVHTKRRRLMFSFPRRAEERTELEKEAESAYVAPGGWSPELKVSPPEGWSQKSAKKCRDVLAQRLSFYKTKHKNAPTRLSRMLGLTHEQFMGLWLSAFPDAPCEWDVSLSYAQLVALSDCLRAVHPKKRDRAASTRARIISLPDPEERPAAEATAEPTPVHSETMPLPASSAPEEETESSEDSSLEAGSIVGWDVFIAYTQVDRDLALLLYEALDGQCAVFMDKKAVNPGDRWDRVIKSALVSAPITVLLTSKHTHASDYVADEISRVLRLQKDETTSRRLIPVYLDGFAREDPIYGTGALQGIDYVELGDMALVAAEILRLHDRLHAEALIYPGSALPGLVGNEGRLSTKRIPARIEAANLRKLKVLAEGGDASEITDEIRRLRKTLKEGPQARPGQHLCEGRYELLEPCGRGAVAVVWRAKDHDTERIVAVKILHGRLAWDRSYTDRFDRGARALSFLAQHAGSGFVRVLRGPTNDGDLHFFVMDYLAGGDLQTAILEGAVSREQLPEIFLTTIRSLAAAHAHQVIHRDIKPSNVLLTSNHSPRLCDLDLVRNPLDSLTHRTITGQGVGTLTYASPEQLDDARRAGVRSDIYSLALTFAFCLHGSELPASVIRDAPGWVRSLRLMPAMSRVLERAVRWEAIERYATVEEFGEALKEALSAW